MKYSLRSLMIVVTLACVMLAGRVEYLRRWAAFHKREAEECAARLNAYDINGRENEAEHTELDKFMRHAVLYKRYARATYQPWTFVDDTP